MEELRPRHIFVLGNALDAFTSAFYLVAYPVFLWHYLPSAGKTADLYKIVSLVLSAKFLFEAFFDIQTSKLADFNKRFSRRQVFLLGMGSHGVVFILLLGIAWTKPIDFQLIIPLMMVELFRSFGNALQSGTFDGWAVSAELSIDPNFSKATMFADARLANRLFLLVGTVFTFLLLVMEAQFRSLPGTKSQVDTGWLLIWVMAILFELLMIVLIWLLTREFACLPESVEPPSKPITSKVARRAALGKGAWTALGLLSSFYSMAMIFTFTWPILLGKGDNFQTWKYGLSILFLVSSLSGASIASTRAKLINPASHVREARIWGMAEAIAFCLASLAIILTAQMKLSFYLWLGVGLLTVGRFLAFIANPFVDSLIHENIGPSEQVRAYVVSWRTAISNISASVIFFIAYYLVHANGGTDPQKAVGIALFLTSLLVMMLLYATTFFSRDSGNSDSQ